MTDLAFSVLISNYLYWYTLYLGQTHCLLVPICVLNLPIPHLFALLLEYLSPNIFTCQNLTNSSKHISKCHLFLEATLPFAPISHPTMRSPSCHGAQHHGLLVCLLLFCLVFMVICVWLDCKSHQGIIICVSLRASAHGRP